MKLDQIRWLLIDLDNTILDYDAAARSALTSTYGEFGIPATDEYIDLYKTINRKYWEEFESGEIDIQTLKQKRFETFVASTGLEVNPDDLNNFYLDKLSEQAQIMSGARDFLDWARSRFRLAVVTNGFPEVQRPRILKAGLLGYFEELIISEEIGSSKPRAEFFQFLYNRIHPVAKNALMIIGDNLYSDIKGGLDFGIQTCWYNPAMQGNHSDVEPHIEISSFSQLISRWPVTGYPK